MLEDEAHELPLSCRAHPANIQQLTGRKPTIKTLVVAIKGFSDTLEELKSLDPVRALGNTRISLSNGIADVGS